MTDQEKETLNRLIAKHKTPQAQALRARIILQFYEGKNINAIVTAPGVVYNTVLKWTTRWKKHPEIDVEEKLEDLPRSGCPDKYSPEQICKIIATCCENPEDMVDLSPIGHNVN